MVIFALSTPRSSLWTFRSLPLSQITYLWIGWARRLILAKDIAEPATMEMAFNTRKEMVAAQHREGLTSSTVL